MPTKHETLDKIPVKAVEDILGKLQQVRAEARSRNEEPRVPLTTFYLRTGQALRGWLLDLEDAQTAHRHGRDRALLVHLSGDGRSFNDEVCYLRLGSIEAVTIHGALEAAPVLTFGAVDASPGSPAPTRLEMRRTVESRSQALAEAVGSTLQYQVDWDDVGNDDDRMRSLSILLDDTHEVLEGLARDDLGREALRRLSSVRLADAEKPSVDTDGDVLMISAALSDGGAGRLDRRNLQAAVEATL